MSAKWLMMPFSANKTTMAIMVSRSEIRTSSARTNPTYFPSDMIS